ncbi:MAG TPA: site-2 protease family protein [Candidatus Anoxymicrobiaceae bacterium]
MSFAAMTWSKLPNYILDAVLIFLVLGFMILTHELGHYFAAKKCGIKVDQFSIGFGPEIKGWTRGETRYSLKWILAGGSVRIAGMNPDEKIAPEDLPRTYYEAPLWKRAIVILAGSFVHLCIAFILFYLFFWPLGYSTLTGKIAKVEKTVVVSKTVTEPGPGYVAGLKKGDLITSVNGNKVTDWNQLTEQLTKRPGQTVVLTYDRGETKLTTKATLLDVNGHGLLGVAVDVNSTYSKKSNPVAAIGQSAKLMASVTASLAAGVARLFSLTTLKQLVGMTPRNQNSPQSIVGATRLAFQAASQGASVFIFIIGEFFLLLALFNLIPLPPLDGGHLLVIIVEKVFHKEINMKTFAKVAVVVIIVLGIVALRLMMLDVFNPLKNPFTP